jgi:hypothetical protein
MPTEEEMRSHNARHQGRHDDAYADPRSDPRYAPPSVYSTGTHRPTLNIFATPRGEFLYSGNDPWHNEFNKRGFKVNLHGVQSLSGIDEGQAHLFSNLDVKPERAKPLNLEGDTQKSRWGCTPKERICVAGMILIGVIACVIPCCVH